MPEGDILKRWHKKGFTIVELLIVIVVIAILAAVSTIAYTNVQAKARDAQRKSDIQTIAKALELYYMDHGQYPLSRCGATTTPACPTPKNINSFWSSTSDGSWNVLESALVPEYLPKLPVDPRSTVSSQAGIYGGYQYEYLTYSESTGCGVSGHQQIFRLFYRNENSARVNKVVGVCPNSGYVHSGYTGISVYTSIKN